HQDGALAWEESAEGRARLEAAATRLRDWDYAIEWISPGQAREIEPDLVIAPGVDRVAFTPDEGYVEVVPLVAALLAAAGRHRARARARPRLTAVIGEGGRAPGVLTHGGAPRERDARVGRPRPARGEAARLARAGMPLRP